MNSAVPIVVDLDGTLTPTDTQVESLVRLAKQSPLNLLRLIPCLLKGRAGFKSAIADQTPPPPELLPYHEPLLNYLREERAKGRRIVLATAAHRLIAERVASHLGLFDQILASDAEHNLIGSVKLRAIQEQVGQSFVYAGDSRADLPLWNASQAAILVGVSPQTADPVRRVVPIEREFPWEPIGLLLWLRALRVHQWLKNLLLFVPLLTAFAFLDVSKMLAVTIAFFAFSLAASASYLVNDLWDLDHDRAHPRKRHRPFASARIPIPYGLAVAAAALILGLALALTVSPGFFLMLLLYLVLTSAYSWALKEYVLIDVLLLSLLYTLRILAGAVAIGIAVSSWLLAFSVFLFLSLALIKRCAELVALGQQERPATRGRDYRVSDLVVLWPLGVGAALSAVVVFELFISAPETQLRYATPTLLWAVAIGLVYWLARLWIKTARGEMHDDPVIYAIKDRGSRLTLFGMIAVMLLAHFLALPILP